ncbi:hypothetical protein [Campylobacter troglodytis]|nr:hypothetical protein [Campylobacter troglodytis]
MSEFRGSSLKSHGGRLHRLALFDFSFTTHELHLKYFALSSFV